MALLLDNPNNAILPDFRTAEHEAARTRLTAKSVADDTQAAEILATLWTMNNNTAREVWAEQIEIMTRATNLARRQAAEEEEDHQRILGEEQEAARKEEQKKNKAKFMPISAENIPYLPVIIPSHYAVQKLKSGDYCELHYFTNKGLHEAKTNLTSTEQDGMIMMPAIDGQQLWVNAGAIRDPKSAITKDKNLLWEEFNEAALHMITAMKQHKWPEDCINMHIQFWMALQNHHWRHAFDKLKQ
ncbi:uncharacterized protein EDB91DRAFT_1238129 [Suillus paluster]|uniref:uncharacterized protein n=1 Tax=Suillus paluster TaxID=48578 RepID=UPI001B86BC18|nr:uncharacterized protein EDB91DRAFT_1238129 [Suillus paluster]KAG1735862.1 hypothetical protein EDB91DRAFT_1238129 [Suillus paluster]